MLRPAASSAWIGRHFGASPSVTPVRDAVGGWRDRDGRCRRVIADPDHDTLRHPRPGGDVHRRSGRDAAGRAALIPDTLIVPDGIGLTPGAVLSAGVRPKHLTLRPKPGAGWHVLTQEMLGSLVKYALQDSRGNAVKAVSSTNAAVDQDASVALSIGASRCMTLDRDRGHGIAYPRTESVLFLDAPTARSPRLIESAASFAPTGAVPLNNYAFDLEAIAGDDSVIRAVVEEPGLSLYWIHNRSGALS